MKVIEPNVELWEQEFPTVEDTADFADTYLTLMYKHIERCGKISYKSENTITDDSYIRFINMLKEKGHLSVFEHGTIYMKIPYSRIDWIGMLRDNPYTCINQVQGNFHITTNYRVILELDLEEFIGDYLCNPTKHHAKRHSVHCITSIGITREANRHRSFSITEQSTRYCNYSKDKFGNEITFIKPYWISSAKPEETDQHQRIWFNNCSGAEQHYLRLIQNGFKPQEARDTLPLSTATDVVYTAFNYDWEHFFSLRMKGHTGEPHPDMKNLATVIYNKLKEHGALIG